jgi:hypothetical protein
MALVNLNALSLLDNVVCGPVPGTKFGNPFKQLFFGIGHCSTSFQMRCNPRNSLNSDNHYMGHLQAQ